MSVIRISNQRAVIDRRAISEQIAGLVQDKGAPAARPAIVELLRAALSDGRDEIARRLAERPSAGHDVAEAQAFLVDQLVRIIHDHVVERVYRASNRSACRAPSRTA